MIFIQRRHALARLSHIVVHKVFLWMNNHTLLITISMW